MEFSKEQVEYLKEEWTNSPERNFIEFANSLIKPERKKIVVEIEYDARPDIELESEVIKERLKSQVFNNLKVSKLPEGTWTDHHMKLFALYYMPDCKHNLEDSFSNFKAERRSELDK